MSILEGGVQVSQTDEEKYTLSYSNFASSSAYSTTLTTTTSLSSTSENRIKTMLQDVPKNANTLTGLSKSIKNVNGMYKRIVRYMSSMLTFDHILYPVFENPFVEQDSEAVKEAFAQTAKFLDSMNIKYHLPIFTEKIITNGAVFLFKLEDSKSVAYQELPSDYCKIAYLEEGVYRFELDITKINDSNVLAMPKEIQSAYQSYKNNQRDNFRDGKWYQVSDKGVAFTSDAEVLMQQGYSAPVFGNVLIDALKVEGAKENMEDKSDLENSKIIHSEVPIDDKGRPLMDLPVVKAYHSSLKANLPTGSVAVTNPFKTTALTLSGTGTSELFSLLDKSTDQLYKGAGVSPQLFADNNNSSQALERSIQVDAQWLYSFVIPMFTNYYNYELKKSKTSKNKNLIWKIKFLDISYFDKNEAVKTAKDQLTYGGSRQEYLAYTGMTPVQVANMLVFEQNILDIDSIMVAKQNSNTLSSEGDGTDGRPPVDNPTNKTLTNKDNE